MAATLSLVSRSRARSITLLFRLHHFRFRPIRSRHEVPALSPRCRYFVEFDTIFIIAGMGADSDHARPRLRRRWADSRRQLPHGRWPARGSSSYRDEKFLDAAEHNVPRRRLFISAAGRAPASWGRGRSRPRAAHTLAPRRFGRAQKLLARRFHCRYAARAHDFRYRPSRHAEICRATRASHCHCATRLAYRRRTPRHRPQQRAIDGWRMPLPILMLSPLYRRKDLSPSPPHVGPPTAFLAAAPRRTPPFAFPPPPRR